MNSNRKVETFLYGWVGNLPKTHSNNDGTRVTMGHVELTNDVSKKIMAIKKYFRENVSSGLVKRVFDMYYWDFVLFGYSLDGFIQ